MEADARFIGSAAASSFILQENSIPKEISHNLDNISYIEIGENGG